MTEETWGKELIMSGKPAWTLDTGRFPKHEPGVPDWVFSDVAPHAIQFNFSRTIIILFRLTPVTKVQIKFGQCCKDDGWILFILSNGGLVGWVGTQWEWRAQVTLMRCSGTLVAVSCWERPYWPMQSCGWGSTHRYQKNLTASDDPVGEDIHPLPLSIWRKHSLSEDLSISEGKKVTFLINVGKMFTEYVLTIYCDRHLLSVFTTSMLWSLGPVWEKIICPGSNIL